MDKKPTYEELEKRIRDLEKESAKSKRGGEALRQDEERFRRVFEIAPLGIVVVNRDLRYVDFNRAFIDFVGYSRAEILSKSTVDLSHPEDRERHRQLADKAWKGEVNTYSLEKRFVRKDGQIRWGRLTSTVLSSEEGHRLGIIEDITERKRAEEALKGAERRYREVIENMATGVAVYEVIGDCEDFIFKDINSAGARTGKIPRLEHLGKSVKDVYPGVREMGILDVFERVWRTGKAETFPMRSYKDDRIELWVENYVFKLPSGEIGAVYDDISQGKKAEEALRRSEARFREMADMLPQAVYEADAQGILTYANRRGLDLFGYTTEDIEKGLDVLQMLVPQERGRAGSIFRSLLRGGPPDPDRRYRAMKKNGATFPVVIYSSPIVHDQRIVGLRGIIVDLTEHDEAEAEKEKLQAQLLQAQKMESVGRLAGGVAHDFNNILGVILGCTELTLMDMTKGDRNRENLSQVYKAAERARDLVKQILTFSRQAPQERKPLRVDLVVKEALKFLRSSLPSTIEIEQQIADNPGHVMGDLTQIHQLIMNLCVNAGHAMSEKGGVLRIEVSDVDLNGEEAARFDAPKPGRYCLLRVKDTGHGMDAATMSRIFDPYFTTKGPEEGTGLGLAVVHGVVKSHRGGITVVSEPGKGTTFEVVLPMMKQETETQLPSQGEAPLGNGEKILVVDDEPGLARMYCGMLESLGYSAEMRTSTIDALRTFSANPDAYDLIFTDMTMPHMTGLDLSKRILKIRPHMLILLSTGFSQAMDEDKAKEQGIRGLVAKPIQRKQLADVLKEVLRSDKSGGCRS